MANRRFALAGSTVAVLLALAACTSTPASNPLPGGAQSAAPGPTSAPAGTSAPATGVAATPSAPPTPSATATAGQSGTVTAVISGLGAHPVLTPGGPALSFAVTVHNGTGNALKDIQPLVAMGHCSCESGGGSPMPPGTLQLLDPGTGHWQSIFYDTEGTGMDYSYVNQISGVGLAAGASETFDYRVALTNRPLPKGAQPVHDGSSIIDVIVQQLPGHTTLSHDVYAPVYVTG
jgi:hypothetical protein